MAKFCIWNLNSNLNLMNKNLYWKIKLLILLNFNIYIYVFLIKYRFKKKINNAWISVWKIFDSLGTTRGIWVDAEDYCRSKRSPRKDGWLIWNLLPRTRNFPQLWPVSSQQNKRNVDCSPVKFFDQTTSSWILSKEETKWNERVNPEKMLQRQNNSIANLNFYLI